ncbi:hypothetical protein GCM10007937_41710 [Mesorhizobium albiziae]|nr:hypothetical protein GCM10007937_41710 [Mesorhizobium albiziae]
MELVPLDILQRQLGIELGQVVKVNLDRHRAGDKGGQRVQLLGKMEGPGRSYDPDPAGKRTVLQNPEQRQLGYGRILV